MMNISVFEKAFLKNENEELSQATARLVFLFFINIFFVFNKIISDNEDSATLALVLSFIVSFYAVFHYKWVKNSLEKNYPRRLLAIFVDTTSVTLTLFFLEWIGLIIYPLYLWIIIGNGMRFGKKYLYIAMSLALLEFGFMPFFHPFWIDHFHVGLGLIWMTILLPFFFLVMIQRLQIANEKLTKQLKIQQEHESILIQQSRHAAMGEMISNIAHQWRQPLNALSLVVQNIENMHSMKMLDDNFMDKSIVKSDMLIQRMSQTIDDFRNFFKPNKHKEIFDITKEINNSLNIIEAGLNNAGINVLSNFQANLTYFGYSNEFSQVILNILANAKDILIERKIMNPKIWINLYTSKEFIILEVIDNGGGVKDDIIDKIFDPYFTTKKDGNGTGIGLYMSKLIIENHLSGNLYVDSYDDGAKFTITLNRNQKNDDR